MMNLKRIAILASLALSVFASAQAPDPKVAVSAVPKEVAIGGQLKLTVTVTFAEGFHGYQNPPASEYEIPVVVKVDGKEFKLTKVIYPAGVDAKVAGSETPTKTYMGAVKIPVVITDPKKIGKKDLKILVSFQQCNEQSCMPPGEVASTVKVNIVKKVKKS